MANVNPTMSITECEWSKQPSGKAGVCQKGQKKRFNYMLSTRHTLHSRLKEKDGRWGQGRIYCENSNHKRAGIVVLILNKTALTSVARMGVIPQSERL